MPSLFFFFFSCPQSPKAVLGNRFIVVDLSEANLVDVDPHYQDAGETAAAYEAAAAKADAAAAVAAQAARKKEHQRLIVRCADLFFCVCVGLVFCPVCPLAVSPAGKYSSFMSAAALFDVTLRFEGSERLSLSRYRRGVPLQFDGRPKCTF